MLQLVGVQFFIFPNRHLVSAYGKVESEKNFALKMSFLNVDKEVVVWSSGRMPTRKGIKKSHFSYREMQRFAKAVVGKVYDLNGGDETFYGECEAEGAFIESEPHSEVEEKVKKIIEKSAQLCLRRCRRKISHPGLNMIVKEKFLLGVLEGYKESIEYPVPSLRSYKGREPKVYHDFHVLGRLPNMIFRSNLIQSIGVSRGLNVVRYSDRTLVLHDEVGRGFGLYPGPTDLVGVAGHTICENKTTTRTILTEAGVPVAEGAVFPASEYSKAESFAKKIGFPVVLKPEAGVKGRSVFTNIGSEAELKRAYEIFLVGKYGKERFIVEKHIDGLDYRVMVVDGKAVACMYRMTAHVIGDGVRTIGELVAEKNAIRMKNSYLKTVPIKINDQALYVLEKQSLSLVSIPEAGKVVLLATSANLSHGGDSVDVTDELHPSVAAIAVKACKAVGIKYCGVDILMEDHSKPASEQSIGICELNSRASVPFIDYPVYGDSQGLAEKVFEVMAKNRGVAVKENMAHIGATELIVRGRVKNVGFLEWIKKHADDLGLRGHARLEGDRVLVAYLEGDIKAISALASLSIKGAKKSVVSSVKLRHVQPRGEEGMRVLA